MSSNAHVTELLPAYALDCLDEAEEIRVSEHLAICATCRAELMSFQTVADQLALAAPDAVPPAHLKRQLLDRVQPAHPKADAEPQPSWREQLTSLWRRVAPVWGAASLILVLILAVSNLMLRQQAHEIQTTSGGMRIVTLSSTDAAPGATGTLVVSLDGEHGTLVVDGLPPLDEAQQYQLWLIDAHEGRTSGGVFSVSPEGYGALWVSSPAPLSGYPAFGITIEPAGGSPGPTGAKVLGGSL